MLRFRRTVHVVRLGRNRTTFRVILGKSLKGGWCSSNIGRNVHDFGFEGFCKDEVTHRTRQRNGYWGLDLSCPVLSMNQCKKVLEIIVKKL